MYGSKVNYPIPVFFQHVLIADFLYYRARETLVALSTAVFLEEKCFKMAMSQATYMAFVVKTVCFFKSAAMKQFA